MEWPRKKCKKLWKVRGERIMKLTWERGEMLTKIAARKLGL
jgi:hypothetical protein